MREKGLDWLRIISCFGVIGIHIASCEINMQTTFGVIVTELVRPGLWCFAALTGYFVLYRRIENIGKFYRKNIIKLVIPLIIYYTLNNMYWTYYSGNNPWSVISLDNLKNIIAGPVDQYWYVYSLIGIYLMLPFFQKMIFNLKDKEIVLLLMLMFLFARIFPILSNIGFKIGIDNFILDNRMLFYVLLGYFLHRLKDEERLKWKNYYILGLLLTYIYFALCMKNNILNEGLYDISMAMTLVVVFSFLIFLNINFKNKEGVIVAFLSKQTFSVYLSHMTIYNFMLHNNILAIDENNVYYMAMIKMLSIFLMGVVITCIIDNTIIKIINKGIIFIENKLEKNICKRGV